MNAPKTKVAPSTPLPHGEFDSISGPDQQTVRNALAWLLSEGAISATVALTQKPHVAVVHRSGWVSTSIDPEVRPLGESSIEVASALLRWRFWQRVPSRKARTDDGGNAVTEARISAEGFSVGSYLKEEMKTRGWTAVDVANRMVEKDRDIWELTVKLLIACADERLTIDQDTADRLGAAFDVSPELLINLNKQYHEWLEARDSNASTRSPEA